ncbi:MAG TPA: hypothetical protein VHN98_06445 [Acidimicrobiales bacterium]|nr:hypothetical protein [Acidimicrobiales bacterium]
MPNTVDFALRPRSGLVAALILAAVGLPIGLFKLEYDAALFDGRVLLIALYALVVVPIVLTVRIVVGESRAWRRIGRRPTTAVALDALAHVSLRRGLGPGQRVPTVRLRVVDRDGNRLEMTPSLWTGGARRLLATIDAAARAQGLEVDDTTRAHLAAASSGATTGVPAWAYRAPLRLTVDVLPGGFTSPRQRVAPRATLVVSVAVLVVAIPTVLFATAKGTAAIRSSRCASERAAWTAAPDVETPAVDLQAWAGGVAMAPIGDATHSFYSLATDDIAGPGNTAAVRQDSGALKGGANVVWRSGGKELAEVHYELFASAADAMRFQHDWGEDHCHSGDVTFAVRAVAGAVGFRCTCGRSVRVDRVGFVQGPVRFQVIVFGLTPRSDHSRALTLATEAHAAAVGAAPRLAG